MNCAELQACLAPLLDGELEPDELEAAADHLESCEACAALVEKLATVPLRPSDPQPPASPEFWDAMDQALAAEAERPPGPLERVRGWLGAELRLSRAAVLAYLALLALAFGWHLLRPEAVAPLPVPVPAPVAVEQPQEPAPAGPPPPARRSQKLEKASYAPAQQTF
jgi:anti-sigma factor RsiW